ncbi:hypothetical protein FRB94_008967 [Tulasnella sp. JGI-2019a]|nr:hypothetical protein FRB93_003502 [Tulasnella sp. JGI-2019a]KAG9014809.1 hypothetical protein FRB94_008967 [Tulasnella sp. JGI-2019a]
MSASTKNNVATCGSDEFLLEMHGYGYDGKRVEVYLRPKISVTSNVNQRQREAQAILLKLGKDIKHSRDWTCEFCDKPSRETVFNVASWMHLTPPRLVVYIHHVCDAGPGPCLDQLNALQRLMEQTTGQPSVTPPPIAKPPGIEYPLASSCGLCHDETSAGKAMSKCGKCKLIRYCSTNYQKQDWPRHKSVCKIVKAVTWVGWD